MTPNEHKLIISVMARQLQNTKTLIDILKSRGVLEGNDPEAFAFSVFLDEVSNAALLRLATEEYLNLAKIAGVQTGLENLK